MDLFESILTGEINNFNIEICQKSTSYENSDIIWCFRICILLGTNAYIMEKLTRYASQETLTKYLNKIEKIKSVKKTIASIVVMVDKLL